VDVLKETYFQRGVGSSIATQIIGRVRSGQITMNEQWLQSVNSLRARVCEIPGPCQDHFRRPSSESHANFQDCTLLTDVLGIREIIVLRMSQ
jgi:hypothetical protein